MKTCCRDVDRVMHAVFGRSEDLLGEAVEHMTADAENDNFGVDFLEDRIQQMLKVFEVRMSAANIAEGEGVTTDISVEGQWRGM